MTVGCSLTRMLLRISLPVDKPAEYWPNLFGVLWSREWYLICLFSFLFTFGFSCLLCVFVSEHCLQSPFARKSMWSTYWIINLSHSHESASKLSISCWLSLPWPGAYSSSWSHTVLLSDLIFPMGPFRSNVHYLSLTHTRLTRSHE